MLVPLNMPLLTNAIGNVLLQTYLHTTNIQLYYTLCMPDWKPFWYLLERLFVSIVECRIHVEAGIQRG